MPHMPVHPFAGPRLCDVPSFEDVQGLLVACWFLKAFPCCFWSQDVKIFGSRRPWLAGTEQRPAPAHGKTPMGLTEQSQAQPGQRACMKVGRQN